MSSLAKSRIAAVASSTNGESVDSNASRNAWNPSLLMSFARTGSKPHTRMLRIAVTGTMRSDASETEVYSRMRGVTASSKNGMGSVQSVVRMFANAHAA